MLHSRRKRLEALAAAEAAGESFWTAHFEEPVRVKVLHALRDAAEGWDENVAVDARLLILRDEGLLTLTGGRVDEATDFFRYLMACPDEMVPTVIEATRVALAKRHRALSFDGAVTQILREHRISYDLVEGQMIEFSSREMHEEVVAPTLRLLAGRADFAKVEQAYQDALHEIAKGTPADAITDAGTALQEALTALGCEGNALGPLVKSARKKGLFAAHDTPLIDAIEKTLHWVSADRSETGDAHTASSASVSDAWLIVHVVGALILRLADATPRAT